MWARVAGVSFGTVSRVLNNAPDVSAATRERVLQVIQDIGYRRDRAAAALVTNRSTSIGIVTGGSPRFGPVGTLMALEIVARKKGYATTVISAEVPYGESVQAVDIAHVAGSMDWFDGRFRKRGWEAALRDVGLPPGVCLEGDWSPHWAYETGLQ